MWHLTKVLASCQLWFSDGLSVDTTRGGHGISSRLIADRGGFLDLTEITSAQSMSIDANGASLWLRRQNNTDHLNCPSLPSANHTLTLSLKIDKSGGFKLSLNKLPNTLTGKLKAQLDGNQLHSATYSPHNSLLSCRNRSCVWPSQTSASDIS